MNEVAFELATPSNYVEECPGCDAMLAYNKKDYFLSNFRQSFKESM
jgi:transcription initiation factor IIE alpha subunit